MVLLVSSGKIIQEITAGIDNLVDECNQEWFLKATSMVFRFRCFKGLVLIPSILTNITWQYLLSIHRRWPSFFECYIVHFA